ncbi:hypothetical protein AQ810_26190 [Burkholderia pseudomallei]|nr:hypothetical protein AQ810_26190 [Burkholderia pseudomallei]
MKRRFQASPSRARIRTMQSDSAPTIGSASATRARGEASTAHSASRRRAHAARRNRRASSSCRSSQTKNQTDRPAIASSTAGGAPT